MTTTNKWTRWSVRKVQQELSLIGYILLSEQYKNAHTKLDIQCDRGHQYKVTWGSFQQGYRCPYCAGKILSYQQIRQFVEQQGYVLLSKQYKNCKAKLDIQCDKGHQYKATWDSFKQGNRCPYCARKIVDYQQIKRFVEQQGYALLSKRYKNCKTKLDFQCDKGHRYKARWNDFQQGYRCPTCNESKGERKVAKILSGFGLFFIPQYPLSKTRLRLDFYIPSLNTAIEYDGKHHFEPIQFGGMSVKRANETLKKQQQNDLKKEALCQQADIKLIRIRFDDPGTLNDLEQFLTAASCQGE